MPSTLRLTVTDYVGPNRWRWVLSDAQGKFLSDHSVSLDVASREYRGFLDLSNYLAFHREAWSPEMKLAELGKWIGGQVFGGLRTALLRHRATPAAAVHVAVPEGAQELLFRPFELACFDDGRSFLKVGLRFVYQVEGTAAPASPKDGSEGALRVLAAFSLPVRLNPLNLRRERYGLQRLVRDLNQTKGLAVELHVLQYGATRETLKAALEAAEGWDIVHLSGHGERGELLLEDERGESDTIDADALGELLEPARHRLKLLILDTCYSGASSHAAARIQVGLDKVPVRQEEAKAEKLVTTKTTQLPSLGQRLAQRLDCAALAMRYPVGDEFATELMLSLYEKLLDRHRALPAALHLALDEALAANISRPPLSAATPILLGQRAADLKLKPPPRPAEAMALPRVGLGIAFPSESERFVGRLQAMVRASLALAPRSPRRGVLFHGMPGAGKTACALELSYRHAENRFRGYVWYRAPEADSDIATELYNVLFEIERQLNAPDLGLTTALDQPDRFRRFTLPRLKALLQEHSLLLVLDNLETLLSESNHWRDPLWGDLMGALLGHEGPSRVVLTSRRVPADLGNQPRLLAEPIHALSFAESVLLARELMNLKPLFEDEAGRALLQETLRVVQGHPKLLELADRLAADRGALEARVKTAADELGDRRDVLDAFFAKGGKREGETRQGDSEFMAALQGWTAGATARLSPTAGLLFAFLCRLEPPDREMGTVQANWKDFLSRLGPGHAVAVAALGEWEQGLPEALGALEGTGLVAVERPNMDPAQVEALREQLLSQVDQSGQADGMDPASLQTLVEGFLAQATTFTIHPGVAEAARARTAAAVLDATDIELGDFHIAMVQQGRKTEMEGSGGAVAIGGRRAAPYLLRQARWKEASNLLEQMVHRDTNPATLAFALPLLRRVASATEGTARESIDAGVLAKVLSLAGRTGEAEQLLRDLIARCVSEQNYRVASVGTGDLHNLLRASGRLAEALTLAEEMAAHTRRAGLGPWSQLADHCRRLQVLADMGRYDEVLTAVEAVRLRLDSLPLEGDAEETAVPWNVRETLLDTGHTAALYTERWEVALTYNAEIVRSNQARGADALALAHTRFNDHGPLLRLHRFDQARDLLVTCRAVFEGAREIASLGKVYTALADLEDNTGGRAEAVRFEEIALRHKYLFGDPDECAISHHNLSNYLKRQQADSAILLAHRLAAATLCVQTQSGHLPTTLKNFARIELPASPPTFAAVVATVEAIDGVRFRELFERLPRTVPDGDAAIAAVWQLVEEERTRRTAVAKQREAVLTSLPAALRTALEQGDDKALRAALAHIQPQEAEALMQQLAEAGVIRASSGPDMNRALREFEPLLKDIAAVAKGDSGPRPELEALLTELEEKGWKLTDATHRIWAGERDADALTDGLDAQDSAIVRRVLDLVCSSDTGAEPAGLPTPPPTAEPQVD